MDEIWNSIIEVFKEGKINLNLGCGEFKIDGTINCDLYHQGADQKIDARDLSKFQNESVNAIYSSNLFEHFDLAESKKVLKEWNRVLRPGGYLILSLPNMKKVIEFCYDWINAKWIGDSPNLFGLWENMMLGIYGWQVGSGQVHQWGYSPEYLINRLEENGFKKKELYLGYPKRPTPNFTVITIKIKKEERDE